MFTKRLTALVLALLMLAGCVSVAQAESDKKTLTVMVYMCGADLEPKNAQATRSIGSMISSRYNTDDINVIILAGGATRWSTNYDPKALTVVSATGRRGTVVTTLPLASMGEADTLTSFLEYCHTNYPADKYILTMWDHGGGPLLDLMADYNFDHDGLSMQELDTALKNSPFANKGLDLIQFHACLMGSTEVAQVVAPYAKYMAASEDSWYGFTYQWLKGADTDASLVETGKRMIDEGYEYNLSIMEAQNDTESNLSLALIDLSQIDQLIAAMNEFFPSLKASLNKQTYSTMAARRSDSQMFGVTESNDFKGYDLVDLGDLVRLNSDADPAAAANLLEALDRAVVYHRSKNSDCTGLTVYHPYQNKKYAEYFVAMYNMLGFSPAYTEYVHSFAALLTGTPLAQWANLRIVRSAADKDFRTLFHMPLTAEQEEHFRRAQLNILFQQEDGSYAFASASNDIDVTDGTLTAGFAESALYTVAQDGTILSPALAYTLTEQGTYIIPVVLHKYATVETDAATEQALISCTLDAQSNQLIPGSVMTWFAPYEAYTAAQGTSLTDYDEITIPVHYRAETRSELGALLPFEQWEIVRTEEWTSPIDDSWSFALVSDTLDPTQLYASFRLTDSQSNLYSSDLLVVKALAVDAGEVRITYDDLDLAKINDCTLTPGTEQLQLSLALENLTDVESIIILDSLAINGTPIQGQAECYGSGANWGLLKGEEQYLSMAIPASSLAGMDAITGMTFNLTVLDAATNESRGTIEVTMALNLTLD